MIRPIWKRRRRNAIFPCCLARAFAATARPAARNALLNYGYTVLRAATARAVVGAGLHPSLSLHHRSKGDALRLVDDLMEPFRPTVDLTAKTLLLDGADGLDTQAKRRLALTLHADFATDEGVTPLSTVLSRLAGSLAQVFLGERKSLTLPISPIPIVAAPTAPADEPDDP